MAVSRPQFKGLLLDMDGTLVDTDHLHFAIFQEMCIEYGFTECCPLTRPFFNTHICGRNNAQIMERLFPEWSLEQRKAFTVVKEKRLMVLVNKPDALHPIKGDSALPIIEAIGFTAWLSGPEGLISGYECKRAKPFPDPYLEGARKLGLPPSECMAIEDSLGGLQAACSAGVGLVVGITTTFGEEQLIAAGAHIVIADYTDERLYTKPLDQRKLQREIWIRKQPATRFGLCICRLEGEMYVTDVRENSIAWNAGINISDRIVSIDDIQLTPHHFDAQTVLDLLYQAGPSLVLRVVDQPRFCRVEMKKSTPNSALGLVYLPGATNEHPGRVTSAYLGCAAEQIANANLSIVSVDGEDTISMPDRDMMEKRGTWGKAGTPCEEMLRRSQPSINANHVEN
ncbi:hypothetical protein SARC_07583 [Sphaeroforma arctica JP610]|uniref:PDZ domain-containing protein n=1 Tax=Sphaeroforma arctica JP610 TaxID=667725 RepID=A0A0L0FTC5_9EUKA|nr:hypothetical protein SARC_07583 [Sphaeroforma arctica JP610]KNC80037.1 hypothetical protein SARC_07583 [Sphaeroforma arctica JP610]|eukprot:XP_014153939.1 hypothetical protein SARC_07583 [Sphaeroforma arctica JP610]